MPLPGPDTIDRFLIAAHLTDIEAVVVLNKIDLAGLSPELDELREELSELYRSLGHTVIETSIKRDEDLAVLRDRLAGRTSALVGQSGVGKSSLVQALLPSSICGSAIWTSAARANTPPVKAVCTPYPAAAG